MFRVGILFLLMAFISPLEGIAQSCSDTNETPVVTSNGYVMQCGLKDMGCLMYSDVNGHLSKGRKFNSMAGENFGLGPLNNIVDAATFLKKCMSENGVYSEKNGTDQTHWQFESELERCNGLLYGEPFTVNRYTFGHRVTLDRQLIDDLTTAYEENGCIIIIDFKLFPTPSGLGHAVEFLGAAYNDNGTVSLAVADPFAPTEPQDLLYQPNTRELLTTPEHRELLRLAPDQWLRLAGITKKCPIKETNAVQKVDEVTASD